MDKKDTSSFLNGFKSEITMESPGRINLIGEHIDYNGGCVLPAAIDKLITIDFRKNGEDTSCNIYTKNYDQILQIDLKDLTAGDVSWLNYVIGVMHGIDVLRPGKLSGFDCIIDSQLPIGSGLSSSAALECGIAKGLNELFDLGIGNIEIIKLCQLAEHNFAGTNCGIMDQFAVVMGQKDHLIKLNCETLEYQTIKSEFEPYKLVLLNTKVSHNLAESGYNQRRIECQSALEKIQTKYPEVKELVAPTEDMVKSLAGTLTEKEYDRALYVTQENQRVNKAIEALNEGQIETFGALMYGSHDGLQHLYEVSCPELDFLVDFAKKSEGVIGSRMMGGGFGGCTINLIHQDHVAGYIAAAAKAYKDQYDIDLGIIQVHINDGVKKQ